ncbi:hypothetical protein PDESU_04861 [Pontiella desulfatans]|uniref:Uncharacterized protein n=1 Tax=Pontiella desulfatans TaxID=2750659 RepID=A0A6C2U890_PONDE|nr:hypothetical protein [Pontiella desulfatans]VGO16270.1 hypothetical protein PDESU_04861 [Pontiella desulfatans]
MNNRWRRLRCFKQVIGILCLLAGAAQARVVSYGISVRTQTDEAVANETVNPGKLNQNLVGGFGADMAKKAKDGRSSISHDFTFQDEVNNINWGFTLKVSSLNAESICGTGSGFGLGDAQFEPGESVVFELREWFAVSGNTGETASVGGMLINRVDMNGFTAGQSACAVIGGSLTVTNTRFSSIDLGECADVSILVKALDLGGSDNQSRISCIGVLADIVMDGVPNTPSKQNVKRRKKPDTVKETVSEPEPETRLESLGLITG